jgi:hypothetical protein
MNNVSLDKEVHNGLEMKRTENCALYARIIGHCMDAIITNPDLNHSPLMQFKEGLSVHRHIIDHAIPLAAGITFSTMVVLAIYKDTLKVNGFLYRYPGTAMSTCNMLNVFFFHDAPNDEEDFGVYRRFLWWSTHAMHV